MYMTEKELFSQYEALKKTCWSMEERKEEISSFFTSRKRKGIVFIGCGSSFSLAKSAALSANLRLDIPSFAFAAGDLLLNFENYRNFLKDRILVSISRSGSTSEVVDFLTRAVEELHTPCVSLCATRGSKISKLADLNIELPWIFDESICQTRCVTNLYTASLLLIAFFSGDDALPEDIRKAVDYGESYISGAKEQLRQIVENGQGNKAGVLADGEMEGIAEEGALAFNEICMLPSHYYHVLDIRHGPMVLVDRETFALVLASPREEAHQKKLIADLKAKGCTVLAFSNQKENIWGADYHISYPLDLTAAVYGIPFIFLAQALSFFKALQLGQNPDQPDGLKPWIQL